MAGRNGFIKTKICIIGPGIVGQATGKAFLEKNFDVSFIGRDSEKIKKLKDQDFKAYAWGDLLNGKFDFDVSMLTVSTPTENGKINLKPMEEASISLGKRLASFNRYHLVVVKSTVLPGTSRNIVAKNIEEYSGKKLGSDFGLCMNPEYLRENSADEDARNPWVIVVGEYDEKSGDILSKLYKDFDSPLFRLSLEEAEIQKYIHNIFNATKISFFNEMRKIGEDMGMDIERVFKLVSLSSEGILNAKYGIRDMGPYLGSCLPKDTQAFYHWAKVNNFNVDVLESVINVNKKIIEKLGLQRIAYKTDSPL